jgi:hypothetical protein
MLTPMFLKEEITVAHLNNTIFENLLEITQNCPKSSSRLLQGILGEFTKPNSVRYDSEAQSKIFEIMITKCD